jgi:hypothetical protein
VDDETEGAREVRCDGEDCEGVFGTSSSSSSSESSPPIAKGLLSSGIWVNGDRTPPVFRGSSIDCEVRLEALSVLPELAFLT